MFAIRLSTSVNKDYGKAQNRGVFPHGLAACSDVAEGRIFNAGDGVGEELELARGSEPPMEPVRGIKPPTCDFEKASELFLRCRFRGAIDSGDMGCRIKRVEAWSVIVPAGQ